MCVHAFPCVYLRGVHMLYMYGRQGKKDLLDTNHFDHSFPRHIGSQERK